MHEIDSCACSIKKTAGTSMKKIGYCLRSCMLYMYIAYYVDTYEMFTAHMMSTSDSYATYQVL